MALEYVRRGVRASGGGLVPDADNMSVMTTAIIGTGGLGSAIARYRRPRPADYRVRERDRRDTLLVRSRPEKQKGPDLRGLSKRLMGLEPTTFCMASRRSSQLSYSRAAVDYTRPTGPFRARASPLRRAIARPRARFGARGQPRDGRSIPAGLASCHIAA